MKNKYVKWFFIYFLFDWLIGGTCAGIFPLTQLAGAQEQYIRACQTQYACQLTPPGGTSWAAGVQTYVFTPMSPDVSIRINVHNQNTTNAHTAQTITLWITSSTTANFSLLNNADRWVQAAVIQNSTANAKCTAVAANNSVAPGAAGQGTCYAQGMYAAQIAIQFTPGGAQAGTVDNFDLDIVQCTNTHCNYPGGPQPGADNSTGGTVGPDPCASINNRSSLTFALASGGAYSQVQSGTAGKTIFVCAITWMVVQGGVSGAALSIGSDGTTGCAASGSYVAKFIMGTNTMPTNTSAASNLGGGGSTIFQLPAGSGLCQAAVAGTGGLTQYDLVFVQQ